MGKKSGRAMLEQLSLFDWLDMAAGAEQAEPVREPRQPEVPPQEPQEPQEASCVDLPLDWGNLWDPPAPSHPSGLAVSIPDGLILSLTTRGRVDIAYIASVTGADAGQVIGALRGSSDQTPDPWDGRVDQGWETADEYLSGNLLRKWKAAKAAEEACPGRFCGNMSAIEQVLPPAVPAKDIYITLGSPWVPPDVVDDFILWLFGVPAGGSYCSVRDWEAELAIGTRTPYEYLTLHDEITGSWEIPCKSRYGRRNLKVCQTYGTSRINALHILERTLNMRTVVVTDEADCPANASGTKRVINQAETVAAQEKQQKLIRAFQTWVWKDERRKKRLETIFEEKYSCVRRRIFDGSFLTFPTLNPAVRLYPYQKDAVARIIFSPNTLLAHDVGSGKTYEMIAAGQELRRMGLSTKNLYVVPNNILGQWRDIFLLMYPQARLLCIDPKAFAPARRQQVLEQARDGDFDGILIAYSCFEQIPLSKEYCLRNLEEQREQIVRTEMRHRKATSKLRGKEKAVQKALAELAAAKEKAGGTVCFDELGITRLFVDEAHNFKNVPIDTKTNSVLGISGAGSKKCQDMMDKVHMIQRKNGGGGVVFATGTPITNSVTDAYIMQQYLQSGELAMLELQSFDSWIGMFAEKTTEFEIDVDTGSYRLATRFAKFHNLPELTALLSSIADFHQVDVSAGIPQMDGYRDVLIARTPEFAAYLGTISRRAEAVRSRQVHRTVDNMLKITTDGRKAALDLRLVDPGAAAGGESKAAKCARNVAALYFQTAQSRSAQLIFCDISTPKAGFNVYDDLKQRLVRLGVAGEEIAFIHTASTERKRNALFAAVRAGEVRVLIGSTFKLGLGVNIQDRLIALHHLDVPWRPADMTQREGRILRQGNTNPKVYLFRYITQGSFDAYSWQLLETKQRFITDLLSGSILQRSGSDIKDTVLSYAEVKALAVGNPLVKQRVEAANELARYQMLQKRQIELRLRLEQELQELPAKREKQRDIIARCREDWQAYTAWKQAHPPAEDEPQKSQEQAARKALRERLAEGIAQNALAERETVLTNYRGFDLVLPVHTARERPYIRLLRRGTYVVELGEADTGYLVRIDHFLNGLGEYLGRQELSLIQLEQRGSEIRAELDKDESYLDQIARYQKKLERLDKKLGVEQP